MGYPEYMDSIAPATGRLDHPYGLPCHGGGGREAPGSGSIRRPPRLRGPGGGEIRGRFLRGRLCLVRGGPLPPHARAHRYSRGALYGGYLPGPRRQAAGLPLPRPGRGADARWPAALRPARGRWRELDVPFGQAPEGVRPTMSDNSGYQYLYDVQTCRGGRPILGHAGP